MANKVGINIDLDEALKNFTPLEIINTDFCLME